MLIRDATATVLLSPDRTTSCGEIQQHLQAMLHLLRPQDYLKMAVRLESVLGTHTRYMAIVCSMGRQDNVESIVLGIDHVTQPTRQTTIGLVLPIFASTKITLDGDGGICVESNNSTHQFKPVSVQAMWSAFQSLHKEHEAARRYPYFNGGLTHTWMQYYEASVDSPESFRSEWHYLPTDDGNFKVACRYEMFHSADAMERYRQKPAERAAAEKQIRISLRDIMQTVDLDEVTSKDIREKLEEKFEMNLKEYKEFIDQEMLIILGQMDKPSKIFDYLYLGTEWNASNWDELRTNNVAHILNVTKEVDNFFPGLFTYMKIRVSDEESEELLQHWNTTYDFIRQAIDNQKSVLVHCKKGISRSSSTVIAYAMKANGWPLDYALNYVKQRRNCITPNKGFMEQLKTYEGILVANRHRNSKLFAQLPMYQPASCPNFMNSAHIRSNVSPCKQQRPTNLPSYVGEAGGVVIETGVQNDRVLVSSPLKQSPSALHSSAHLLVASENILKSCPPATTTNSGHDRTNLSMDDALMTRRDVQFDDNPDHTDASVVDQMVMTDWSELLGDRLDDTMPSTTSDHQVPGNNSHAYDEDDILPALLTGRAPVRRTLHYAEQRIHRHMNSQVTEKDR